MNPFQRSENEKSVKTGKIQLKRLYVPAKNQDISALFSQTKFFENYIAQTLTKDLLHLSSEARPPFLGFSSVSVSQSKASSS